MLKKNTTSGEEDKELLGKKKLLEKKKGSCQWGELYCHCQSHAQRAYPSSPWA